MGTAIDEAAIGGTGGGEVAPDQSLEDAVAAKGDEGAVVGVQGVGFGVVGGEAVVEVCGVVLFATLSANASFPHFTPTSNQKTVRYSTHIKIQPLRLIRAHHLPQIPQLTRLILAITNNIPSIALTINIRNPLRMSQKHARRPHTRQTPAIPNFQGRVVRSTVQNVW